MVPNVWNALLPPFPREGLNHLLPSDFCQVTMFLRKEAAKLARLSQLDLPNCTPEMLKKFQRKLRAKLWEKMGVKYVIFTDISKDGTLSGPNLTQLADLSAATDMNIIR